MRTSKAGTFGEGGFTLIEFAIVAAILGIVFALVFPRVYRQAADPLRVSAQGLAEAIRKLRTRAVSSNRMVRFRITLPEGKWRVEGMDDEGSWRGLADSPVRPGLLPPEITVRKVRFGEGEEIVEGLADLRFLPTGETREAFVLLAGEDGRERTLTVHPFLNRVEIHHGRLAKTGG